MFGKKIFTVLFLVLLLGKPFLAGAFSVFPLQYTLTMEPNSAQVVRVKIKNTESQPVVFKLQVVGVKQDQAGRPIFGVNLDAAEAWVKPEMGEVSLKPKEEKTVLFDINVPAGESPLLHTVGLGVQAVSNSSAGVGLSGQIAVLLSLQVAGVVNESVSVVKFSPRLVVTAGKDWQLNLNLKNSGTATVPISGKIVVRNIFGEELMARDEYLGNKLLPQANRDLAPKIMFTSGGWFWPGVYPVEVRINYGLTNQSLVAFTRVWYVPPGSIILGSFILGVFIASQIFKKAKKQKSKLKS